MPGRANPRSPPTSFVRRFVSIHHDKNVPSACHAPVASLAVPVAVFVRVPVGVIPVVVRMHRCAAVAVPVATVAVRVCAVRPADHRTACPVVHVVSVRCDRCPEQREGQNYVFHHLSKDPAETGQSQLVAPVQIPCTPWQQLAGDQRESV